MKRKARNVRLYLRVNEDEHEAIKGKAKLSGLSVSEYARRLALGFKVCSKFDFNVLNELRRQGGLIEHVKFSVYRHNLSQNLQGFLPSHTQFIVQAPLHSLLDRPFRRRESQP